MNHDKEAGMWGMGCSGEAGREQEASRNGLPDGGFSAFADWRQGEILRGHVADLKLRVAY